MFLKWEQCFLIKMYNLHNNFLRLRSCYENRLFLRYKMVFWLQFSNWAVSFCTSVPLHMHFLHLESPPPLCPGRALPIAQSHGEVNSSLTPYSWLGRSLLCHRILRVISIILPYGNLSCTFGFTVKPGPSKVENFVTITECLHLVDTQ